jgi:hypothetical protein
MTIDDVAGVFCFLVVILVHCAFLRGFEGRLLEMENEIRFAFIHFPELLLKNVPPSGLLLARK